MSRRSEFSIHFLSSGSSGNSTLMAGVDGCVLLDFGLHPAMLWPLLAGAGLWLEIPPRLKRSWRGAVPEWGREDEKPSAGPLRAVVLSHCHGDHFHERSLALLFHSGAELWLHEEHVEHLGSSRTLAKFEEAGRLRRYGSEAFRPGAGATTLTPVPLPHDSPATHGFVVEHDLGGGRRTRACLLSDMGHAPPGIEAHAAGCELVALEFNHCAEMERRSRRHPRHIARVLGPYGHLSNDEASELLGLMLKGGACRPRHVVLTHLSRDCNRPELAWRAAARALVEADCAAEILVTQARACAGRCILTGGGAEAEGDAAPGNGHHGAMRGVREASVRRGPVAYHAADLFEPHEG